MIPVTLQPRSPQTPLTSSLPLLDAQTLESVLAKQSEREAFTVCAIVHGELCRRGYRAVSPGGPLWNATVERVVSDVVGLGLDLAEIGAQIEEARWEHGV